MVSDKLNSDTVNVVCFKWGQMYGAEYVNKLFRMVQRNLSYEFRFVCFTDDASGLLPQIDSQPLPDFPEPSLRYQKICAAWRKLALFKIGLADLRGKTLFLDLDVVLMGALDSFFDDAYCSAGAVTMLNNWYQPGSGQASVFSFVAGENQTLLDQYLDDPDGIAEKYRTEQNYISLADPAKIKFYPDGWCLSFKKHVMPTGPLKFFASNVKPDDCKVLVFHGRPNPPDAIAGRWGKKIAWYKRWAKPIQPAPWIADYWY